MKKGGIDIVIWVFQKDPHDSYCNGWIGGWRMGKQGDRLVHMVLQYQRPTEAWEMGCEEGRGKHPVTPCPTIAPRKWGLLEFGKGWANATLKILQLPELEKKAGGLRLPP